MLSRSQPFSAGILSTLVKNVVVFSRAVVLLPSPPIILMHSPRPPPSRRSLRFLFFGRHPLCSSGTRRLPFNSQLSQDLGGDWKLHLRPPVSTMKSFVHSTRHTSSSRVTSHNTVRRYIFAHCVSLFCVRFKYGAVGSRSWPPRVVDAPFKVAWGAHRDGTYI